VHWNERWGGWIVAKYDDVHAGLHDPRMMGEAETPCFDTRLSAGERGRFRQNSEVLNSWPVFVDPPKHTKLRRMFSRSFTPRSVETMRCVVERFVDEFLASWHGRDDIDLISDFGLLMPASVIASIIGARPICIASITGPRTSTNCCMAGSAIRRAWSTHGRQSSSSRPTFSCSTTSGWNGLATT
jgi:cytochrome P450